MKWSDKAIQAYIALIGFASLALAVIAEFKWSH